MVADHEITTRPPTFNPDLLLYLNCMTLMYTLSDTKNTKKRVADVPGQPSSKKVIVTDQCQHLTAIVTMTETDPSTIGDTSDSDSIDIITDCMRSSSIGASGSKIALRRGK